MLKQVKASLPRTIESVFFRADSGFFSGELLDLLEGFGWDYLIKVKLKNLKELLEKQQWQSVNGRNDISRRNDISICEFDYTTKSWGNTVRRFKAVRRVKEYVERDFFGNKELVPVYEYACYVSSYKEENALELHNRYKKRAESETWIEQVKSQLLAGKTLVDDFWAMIYYGS